MRFSKKLTREVLSALLT